MEKITIEGEEKLSEIEKQTAKKLLDESYPKIQRMLKNNIALFLRIKEYNTEGKRKRYSLELDCKSETHNFKAEAMEWEFPKALHKVIEKIKQEIEHKFHVSEQK